MGVELVAERDVITVEESLTSSGSVGGDVTSSQQQVHQRRGRRMYFSCASSHPLMQSVSSVSSFELSDDDDDDESIVDGRHRGGGPLVELRFKVLFVGDACVGKTSFMWKYVSDAALDPTRTWTTAGKISNTSLFILCQISTSNLQDDNVCCSMLMFWNSHSLQSLSCGFGVIGGGKTNFFAIIGAIQLITRVTAIQLDMLCCVMVFLTMIQRSRPHGSCLVMNLYKQMSR